MASDLSDTATAAPLTPDDSVSGGDGARAPAGYWRLTLRAFVRSPLGVIGVVLLVIMLLFSFVGPLFYHTSPNSPDILAGVLAPPTSAHPLGTDAIGRDILARLMVGGQSSLEVGIAAGLLAVAVGTVYGAIAGFFGGRVDTVMMRLVDVALAIPILLLLLLLSAEFSTSEGVLIVIIGLISWLQPARLIRGETLTLRTREYVRIVKIMGGTAPRTITRHILPNALGTIVVNATFQVADAILALSYLSFLGLGIPPPTATWGGILSDGLTNLSQNAWWCIYPPGICILLTVVAFNFIGDGLRGVFERRLGSR